MNNDSYKVIISVSHHRIAFEYWQRDGENALVPMPGVNWPVPLAFYCSPTGIEIGEAGVRAAHAGTANAFDNYFERLASDEHYVFGGQKKPLRYIFLDAAEEVFTEFFKNVLLGSKGTLSDNRATMPITLVCESDIKPNERALLLNLFRDSGYNRFKVVEYNSYIEDYFRTSLAQEYGGKEMVVAWTEGKDLTLSLFSITNATERRQETFIGLGKDPRQEYVKGLIWDRIKGQNPWLEYEDQEDIISKAAADFLSSSLPLLNDRLTMSDGMSYHYSLTRSVIDYLQCEEGALIRSNLDRFLAESGIKDKKQVLLLLRGLTAGNVYFEQNLSPGFPFVLKTDKRLRSNTMNLLLAEPNPYHSVDPDAVSTHEHQAHTSEKIIPATIILKEKTKQWCQIKAEANDKLKEGQGETAIQILKNFLSECESIVGTEEICSEVNDEIAKISVISVPVVDKAEIKRLERDWREVRASAKGKVRGGSYDEARVILNVFLQKVSHVNGTDTLQEDVRKELNAIPESSEKSAPSGFKHVRQRVTEPINPKVQKTASSQPRDDSEGNALVKEGKLKEARDWYRSHNEMGKAGMLTDIIRSKKGIDLRKNSLEEYRKSKNKDQINRIIKEIEEFIGLCVKVSVPCDSYKKLLNDYKRI